jgi:CRP-like cAMP-binding protein
LTPIRLCVFVHNGPLSLQCTIVVRKESSTLRATPRSAPTAARRKSAPTRPDPHQNHLLDALPSGDYERVASHLELLPMNLGDMLYESGAQLRYVYFPTTSIISLLYVMADGASAEIAIVGNEGILGISLFMGGDTTPSRAVVQSAGHAFRLEADLLKIEFARFGPTMHLLLRYTQALITQMLQTAVCNRHHSVDKQLCRWLLLGLDRLQSNSLSVTQQLIANMPGVRQECAVFALFLPSIIIFPGAFYSVR